MPTGGKTILLTSKKNTSNPLCATKGIDFNRFVAHEVGYCCNVKLLKTIKAALSISVVNFFLTLDDPVSTDVLITKDTNSILLFNLKLLYINVKIIKCISLALLKMSKKEKKKLELY